jgi:CRISPR type IV-associated protein Csf1
VRWWACPVVVATDFKALVDIKPLKPLKNLKPLKKTFYFKKFTIFAKISVKSNMNLISRHLDPHSIKAKLQPCPSGTVCAYSGLPIAEGYKFSDIITDRFTDRYIFRYPARFLSLDFVLLISPVIKSEKGYNSLRNYSFFASENSFKTLAREDILPLILNIPETPFQFGVTYSNKKHISYKAPVNYSPENFIVATDLGLVEISISQLKRILPVMQAWYSVLPDKIPQGKHLDKQTLQTLPTYLTKANIEGAPPSHKQLTAYGIEKFYAEDAILQPFRKTMFLKFIVFILNKSVS